MAFDKCLNILQYHLRSKPSPWTPPLNNPLSSLWDICTYFIVIVLFNIWTSACSISLPCRGCCGCVSFFRCNRFSSVSSLSAGAAMNSSESLPPSSSVNDISSMSTDQTLASDTDSSLETSAGPLGCCRWLTACLRNPVFFRRWTRTRNPQTSKICNYEIKKRVNIYA